MKNVAIAILCFFVVAFSCNTTKLIDVYQRPNTCGYELHYSLGGLPVETRSAFSSQGINKMVLINQRNIDGRQEGELNIEILQKAVARTMPDTESRQLVALDWEGTVMDALLKGKKKDPEKFMRSAALYREAYNVVKAMRPNAMVGFYGFPIRNYHRRSDDWKALNLELDDLFGDFDVLFPSIYDFYDGGSSTSRWEKDINYASDNTSEAVSMGSRLELPVYPFIWHRYHTSNKKKGKELIPIMEFKAHLRAIIETEVDGRHVNGIVWWGSEYSQYATRNKGKIDRKVMRATWEEEAKIVLPVYAESIIEVLNSQCVTQKVK